LGMVSPTLRKSALRCFCTCYRNSSIFSPPALQFLRFCLLSQANAYT
jgi:hypothetical protein